MAINHIGHAWYMTTEERYADAPTFDRYTEMAIANEDHLDRYIKAQRKYHAVISTAKFDGNKDVRTMCEVLGIPEKPEIRHAYMAFAKKKAKKSTWLTDMQLLEVFGDKGSGFEITLIHDDKGWRTDPTQLTECTQKKAFLESPCTVTKKDGTSYVMESQIIEYDTGCALDEDDIMVMRWPDDLDIIVEDIDEHDTWAYMMQHVG